MKKKILCLLLSIIGFTSLFAGCSGTNKQVSNSNNAVVVDSKEKKDDTSKSENKKRVMPDMIGKVTTVLGNEITIDLVQMPEKTKLNKEDMEKKKAEMKNQMGGVRNNSSLKDSVKFTGESTNFIIPVGTPIISTKRVSGERQETELQLDNLYEGMILQIWLKEGTNGDDKIAVKVSVSSM